MEDKSLNIQENIASPIVTGYVSGSVYNTVENSLNTYTQEQKQTLAEAAVEIQQLLTQLEQSYSTNTTSGKMTVATEAIKCIENNPQFVDRILSALKAGGIQALAQLLNHPAASFFIGALEDWQKTKGDKY